MASGDRAIDELYAAPPTDFVKARDELAKQLKADGDPDAAKAVKQLRRPTVAAWAVNQLRRRHPQELDELLELGERLRRAQAKVMTGGGAGTLKELLAERRATVARMARLAEDELGASGSAQRDAIVATLEAALADPADAEAVRRGRLSKELPAPSGFGVGDWSTTALDDDDAEPDNEQQRRRAQREVDEKRGALRQATEEVDAAQREHEAADSDVERLDQLLTAARQRAERAAERRRLAERRAGTAVEALEEAERVLRDVSREYRG